MSVDSTAPAVSARAMAANRANAATVAAMRPKCRDAVRMVTTVYTDGACVGNPGPGGWAWAVPGGRFASGADPATTNQRMEILAALEAVRAIDGPLEIV